MLYVISPSDGWIIYTHTGSQRSLLIQDTHYYVYCSSPLLSLWFHFSIYWRNLPTMFPCYFKGAGTTQLLSCLLFLSGNSFDSCTTIRAIDGLKNKGRMRYWKSNGFVPSKRKKWLTNLIIISTPSYWEGIKINEIDYWCVVPGKRRVILLQKLIARNNLT